MTCSGCLSLRSAVYFGASIHVFLGAMQFSIFSMQTSNYLYRHYSGRPEEPSLTWTSFLILLLGALFFLLGCIIFRGVEKEKVNLIKWPMMFFFVFKVIEMSLKTFQSLERSQNSKKVDWESKMYCGIDISSSSLYFIILFFYFRKLAKRKRFVGEGDYFQSPPVNTSTNTLTMKSSKLLENAEFQ